MPTTRRRPSLAAFASAAALALTALAATAQPVYRQVGPDGRVTFSDQPPAANAPPARPGSGGSTAGGAATGTGALPYELRQVVQRYPVVLYASKACAPCDAGRNLLNTRGIPFSERTIDTPEDAEALQRLSGQTSLPLVAIGTQQLKGFSDSEWTQFLDAAGYPRSNQLPAGFQRAAPAPLVAQQAAAPASPAAPAASPPTPQPAPATAPSGPTPSNPAGIRF